jgi:hypothetical protein
MPCFLRPQVHFRFILVIFFLAALMPLKGLAVIVAGTDGQGTNNTTKPSSGDVWFDYVGDAVGTLGSAIYLGYGYVLTANHTGLVSNYSFGGVTYSRDTSWNGGSLRIGTTDLRIIKLNSSPNLTPLTLTQSTPVVGTPMKMMGFGRQRETNITYWNTSWQEILTPPTGNTAYFEGYKWLGTNIGRWGNTTRGDFYSTNVLNSRAFGMEFLGTAANASMGSPGDSGGAVFVFNSITSQWELAGMLAAIGQYSGQPSASSAYVFSGNPRRLTSGNLTWAVDVAFYRDDILTIIPEPRATLSLLAFFILTGTVLMRARKARHHTIS